VSIANLKSFLPDLSLIHSWNAPRTWALAALAISGLVMPMGFARTAHAAALPTTGIIADDLRCEYRPDPLGIGVLQPRLSWVDLAPAGSRGVVQSRYRILVASSPGRLAQNQGDLWDSGEVASNQTAQVAYAGTALEAREACWWKVQVWDGHGSPGNWSPVALWSVGLLSNQDWTAKWIGFDAPSDSTLPPESEQRLFKQKWAMASPQGDEKNPRTASFRREFILPPDAKITKAVLHLSPDQICDVQVNGHHAGTSYRWELSQEIDATASVHPGVNVVGLTVTQQDGYPPAVLGEMVIEVQGQPPMILPVDATWKVYLHPGVDWQKPGYETTDALAPTIKTNPTWGTPTSSLHQLTPVPYLRKEFTVAKTVRRATLYATALGVYEFHLNGQKVGHDVLTPGWTDFPRRVYYQTYDITSMLHPGVNAAGAILGDGWYASAMSFTGKRNFYGGNPRLKAQLEIEYTDGTTQTMGTDSDWKATTGPLRYADIWLGCYDDARRELPGWDLPDAPGEWSPVVTGAAANEDGVQIQAQPSEPVREFERMPARKVSEPQPHVYVFDLGQNMVGWAHLRLHGKPGQKITVRYGEMLNPDGMVYTSNLRGAIATDFFLLKGGAEEMEPLFTFHGFRYVEVLGLDGNPGRNAVEGVVIHSDIAPAGGFECSSPLVNQLARNIVWGQKGNYLYIPTDCPQRDERLGWTGDTQFFIRTGSYNFDVAGFFTNWLVTLAEDSQAPAGTFAHVAPDVLGGGASTAWGDAALTCTYTIYKVYGDTRIILDHWDALNRYMAWLATHTNADGVSTVGGFGDWLNKGGGASPPVIDTAYHAYLAGIMAEMAHAIGKTDDETRYAALHQNITEAFDHNFVQSNGRIKDSGQTGFALAFTMDLLPSDIRPQTANQFVDDLQKTDWHLATGFIGTPRLLPALHLADRDDVAYKLLLQETYPSWLYQVKLGATTTWERWDGWTPETGFADVNMNSFNHYGFGSVGEYLYRYVAGIDTDGPGYRRIIVAPRPEPGLTWAKAHYDSINGLISSAWKQDAAGGFTLSVSVPANTSALIRVPAAPGATIMEGSTSAEKAAGVSLQKRDHEAAFYEVGSGSYVFHSR
jgi:alpha-L-rhamnosidase